MAILEREGNFWIDVRVKGRRIRRNIGPDRTMAELVVKDLEVKAAKEEYLGIVEQRKVRFTDFTLKDYLPWSEANKAVSTYAADQRCTSSHLIPIFGKRFMSSITPKDLEDYKTHRSRFVKPRTVNRELDLLKSIFSRAVEWGVIREHPGKGVRKLKFQKQPPNWLTPEQVEQLLAVIDKPHLRMLVVLGAHTGMRKGEMFRLTWSDVDMKRRELTIREAKNDEFRVVPMNEVVYHCVRQHPRHIKSDLVICRPDEEGSPYVDLRSPFHAALELAGLSRIRIHDLRHTFGSNLAAAGESLAVVRDLMGHSDIQTTMIYLHLAPDQKRAAVESLVKRPENKGQYGQDLDTKAIGT